MVGFCLDTCHAHAGGNALETDRRRRTPDHRPDRPGALQRQPRRVRLRRRPARQPRPGQDRPRPARGRGPRRRCPGDAGDPGRRGRARRRHRLAARALCRQPGLHSKWEQAGRRTSPPCVQPGRPACSIPAPQRGHSPQAETSTVRSRTSEGPSLSSFLPSHEAQSGRSTVRVPEDQEAGTRDCPRATAPGSTVGPRHATGSGPVRAGGTSARGECRPRPRAPDPAPGR